MKFYLMLSIEIFEQIIFNHKYYSDSLGEKSTWYKILPKGIPVAVQRKLYAHFQEQNEFLERMM